MLGDVFGTTVFVRAAGVQIEAGPQGPFGGEARGLTGQSTNSRQQ